MSLVTFGLSASGGITTMLLLGLAPGGSLLTGSTPSAMISLGVGSPSGVTPMLLVGLSGAAPSGPWMFTTGGGTWYFTTGAGDIIVPPVPEPGRRAPWIYLNGIDRTRKVRVS